MINLKKTFLIPLFNQFKNIYLIPLLQTNITNKTLNNEESFCFKFCSKTILLFYSRQAKILLKLQKKEKKKFCDYLFYK